MLSQETIQNVHCDIPIEEVIGRFVDLKKRGLNLWGCCPFHHERTPSFSVSPNKGFYKCFGCGASGDSIKFIQQMEGLTFVEATKFLANQYNIKIVESIYDSENILDKQEQDSLYIVSDFAKNYYMDALHNSIEGKTAGLSYFLERRFSETVIKKFELGYSYDSWSAFYEHAKAQSFDNLILEQSGLVICKESRYYDRFRSKVIFPIHNVSGKVIGFGARIIKQDINQPKYINSPETPIYTKGNSLYGIFQAKNAIRQLDNCYLVEGYIDVITMYEAGINNVVASLGTSLTENQIKLLSRFTTNITMLFDGDSAGVKASIRNIDMLLANNIDFKIVPLPNNEDPDSFIRKIGSIAFHKYVQDNACDFITFKVNQLARSSHNDPVKKSLLVHDIIQNLSTIPDEIKRTFFTKQCSSLLNIDESILLAEQNKIKTQSKQFYSHHQYHRTYNNQPLMVLDIKTKDKANYDLQNIITSYEKESIRMLLNYGNIKLDDETFLYEYLINELEDVHFTTSEYKVIWEEFQKQLLLGNIADFKHFTQHLNSEIQQAAIELCSSPHEISSQWSERYQIHTTKEEDDVHKSAFKNILRLKLKLVQRLIENNIESLKQISIPEEEDNLMQIHISLKEAEINIGQQLGITIW